MGEVKNKEEKKEEKGGISNVQTYKVHANGSRPVFIQRIKENGDVVRIVLVARPAGN